MKIALFNEHITPRLAIERLKIDIAGGGIYTDAQGIRWGYDANGNFVGMKRWAQAQKKRNTQPLEQRMAWLRTVPHSILAEVTLYVDDVQEKMMNK